MCREVADDVFGVVAHGRAQAGTQRDLDSNPCTLLLAICLNSLFHIPEPTLTHL